MATTDNTEQTKKEKAPKAPFCDINKHDHESDPNHYYNRFNRFENEADHLTLEEQKLVPSEDKFSRTLRIIICYLPVILFLTSLIISGCILKAFEDDIDDKAASAARAMSYYSKIINQSPMQDITVVKLTEVCPFGYEQFEFAKFGGIYQGCSCTDESAKYSKDECMGSATVTCGWTDGVTEQSMNIWKEYKVCIQGYNTVYKLHNEKKKNRCPVKGAKKCSAHICVEANAPCPITSLEVKSKSYVPKQGETVKDWVQGFQLIVQRSDLKSPLVTIQAAIAEEKHLPCIDQNQLPKKPSKSEFPLTIMKSEGCLYWGEEDGVAEILDDYEQSLYLRENGIKTSTIARFEDYIKNVDRVHLFSVRRPHVGQAQICLANDQTQITNWADGITHVQSDLYNESRFILILSCIGFSICVLMSIFRRSKTFGSQLFLMALHVYGYFLSLVLIAAGIHFWIIVNSFNIDVATNRISAQLDKNCFQQPIYNAPAQYINEIGGFVLKVLGGIYTFFIIFGGAFILISIISSLIRHKKGFQPCLPYI